MNVGDVFKKQVFTSRTYILETKWQTGAGIVDLKIAISGKPVKIQNVTSPNERKVINARIDIVLRKNKKGIVKVKRRKRGIKGDSMRKTKYIKRPRRVRKQGRGTIRTDITCNPRRNRRYQRRTHKKIIMEKMKNSIEEEYEIVRGVKKDYEKFKEYHYCKRTIGVPVRVFLAVKRGETGEDEKKEQCAIVVYVMTIPLIKGRKIVMGEKYEAKMGRENLRRINQNFRRLSRVVVKPEYRGKGIAEWMVKKTVETLGVRYVECVVREKQGKGFLKSAGFRKYEIDERQDYYLYENKKEEER
jgi:ribosomal protein S18 acetylase RimI-like enzyme